MFSLSVQLKDTHVSTYLSCIYPSNMSYLLSLNCGSSSIKGKLFGLPRGKEDLEAAATISVSNIGSKGDKVSIKINWNGDKGEDVDTKGDEGDSVEREFTVKGRAEREIRTCSPFSWITFLGVGA